MKISAIFLSLIITIAASAEEKPSCCAEKESSAEAAGSVYQLDAKWTSQQGKELSLSDFKGKPVLLTMGYASCQYACPRLVADLMAIERELSEEEREAVQIVFVSIDPERDTPGKMTAFFKERNVDQSRWTGLVGNDEAVLELSVAIGTRFRKLENNDFAHSNMITLLTSTGEIAHKQEGLGTAPAEMVAALRKAITDVRKSN